MSVISSIVEPVVRQARRLSRMSTGEDSTTIFPESFRNWNPSRLWNTSPQSSIIEVGSEADSAEGSDPSYSPPTRQWARSMPPPPPDVMPSEGITTSTEVRDFENNRRSSPGPDENHSFDSSINPSQELPERSRLHEADSRPYSSSDPAIRERAGSGGSTGSDFARAFYDGDTQALARDGSAALPADDGMGPMRKKIHAIWEGNGSAESKSQMLQALMTQQYNASRSNANRPMTPSSLKESEKPGSPMSLDLVSEDNPYQLSEADLTPTYAPVDLDQEPIEPENTTEPQEAQLGCNHYKRNVKLQCFTCKKWYTCRFCHDESSDHVLPRQQTKNMLCMLCKLPQVASSTCKGCGEPASSYFCSVCKLWNDDPSKPIYHCDDCGICRLGQGLGRDFFHCKTCCVCMSMGVESTHRCIERSTKCDCPICGDFLFTSPSQVVFMRCGHSIHDACFKAWCTSSYRCPICAKSIINMETQFRNLDRQIAGQPMPAEYAGSRAFVHCNDCSRRGIAPYHWLGLKCEHCESYNTQQHHLLGADGRAGDPSLLPSAPRVTAAPPLPLNVADEAVAIPNPGAAASVVAGAGPSSSTASRRASSVSFSDARQAGISPWLRAQGGGARSVSPTVGNYFGTGQGRDGGAGSGGGGGVMPYLRRVLSREDGRSGSAGGGGEESSEDDDDDDDDNDTEDGEDEDDNDLDVFELPGHR